jgi:glycosyltransferase involved in cell wall biosynthesis
MNSKPKVAVCVIAYNQEPYIDMAISSVIKQQTKFPFWLVIGEDCSTDGTRDIIQKYEAMFPNIVKPIYHERNVGIYENYQRTFAKCREAEYIATLDPDDYYVATNKLQSHVDILEQYPDLSACFSNTKIEYVGVPERKPHYIMPPERKRQIFGVRDILRGNFIANCSIVYRGTAFRGIPEWYPKERRCLDWVTHIDVATRGNIFYFPQVMSVYRFLSGSDWSGRGELRRLQESIKALEVIDEHYEFLLHEVCEKTLTKWRAKCEKLSRATA